RIEDYLGGAGSQQAVIPGYGGQPMSMAPPGAPSMPMQINGLLRPLAMGPPPTAPGGITPTSNAPPNPGAMHQEIQQRLKVGLLTDVTLTTLPLVYRYQLKVVLLPLHVFLQMSKGLRTSLNM
ncbi:hypothetical protein MKW92_011323, partial [Papaver armeniacum]